MSLTPVQRYKSHGGWTEFYRHPSRSCQAEMRFSVFIPPQAEKNKVPVVYWLSGLTCTEENFMVKAGAQAFAAQLGIMLVAPDTSPRKTEIPGEDTDWEVGTGAGFYVNATQPPWNQHFRLYDYVAEELPGLIRSHFPVLADRESICGHSMGGHGALVLALRQPGRYRSVSAFAPICAPSLCPWGQKAFSKFLGEEDRTKWLEYDSHALMAQSRARLPMLVDQGSEDKFLTEQLKPEKLREAAQQTDFPLEFRMQPGYDHSYYFIASFIGDHLRFHAHYLNR